MKEFFIGLIKFTVVFIAYSPAAWVFFRNVGDHSAVVQVLSALSFFTIVLVFVSAVFRWIDKVFEQP